MRFIALALACLATLAAAAPGCAQEVEEDECLSSGDMQEAVTSHRVVAPTAAIVLARRAVPNADVLRASLCREPTSLVYRITVLRTDGRLIRVTVDGASGTVKAVQ